VLPAEFLVDGKGYYENVTMTREELYQHLKAGSEVSTSQPSVMVLMELWDEELKDNDQIVYIPISSGLSGSCMSAASLAMDEKYEGRVFVVDNGRVATPQYRTVLDAIELKEEGYDAPQIKEMLETARAEMTIYVAVDKLDYLKKGGRVSAATALVGSVLNIKPVLQFDVGTLNVYGKARGMKGAKRTMIEAMRQELDTKFKEQYERGEVHLLAASSASEAETAAWVEEIKEAFPGMEVTCKQLPLAICCHIGPDGLGIGCSCAPKRIAK
jgi:DegV family protein with EDD domain